VHHLFCVKEGEIINHIKKKYDKNVADNPSIDDNGEKHLIRTKKPSTTI
jgi:hypothetical protein